MKKKYQWEVGDYIFIRSVTYHYIGCIEEISDDSIWLSKSVWVADSGRFSNALTTGNLSEVEPYPGDGIVQVMKSSIVDISLWSHEIPRETK